MSVTLFEPALKFLLEDQDGPVGLDLELRSRNIADLYRRNVMDIIPAFGEQGGDVSYRIENTEFGLVAIIGIDPGAGQSDNMAQWLADKVVREPEKATDAAEQGNHR